MGATGLTTTQARRGLSNYAGFDPNVWYQAGDMRPVLRSKAATAVNGVVSVSNLHQLQLMGADLAGSYVLNRDLDAGATNSTDASAGIFGAGGFVPVGDGGAPFTGYLSGAGHTITGLTIARPSQDYVGLIGYLASDGSVNGSGLDNGSVSGLGLVGGSISGSYFVGGLVGLTEKGTITQSYATGSLTGAESVGGLVGFNSLGTVRESYATGGVSGTNYVGGLVGTSQSGTIEQSYATASVLGNSNVGGLVGINQSGTITQSYATGTAIGSDSYVGGLVGYDEGGSIGQSYATGNVSGGDSVGGLVGYNDGIISRAYATGNVSGGDLVGGLVGSNGGTLTSAYWDTETTRQMNGVGSGSAVGATGRTTAQMQDLASFATTYAGFDFATTWAPPNQAGQGGQANAYYPELYAFSGVLAVTPASATRVYGDANPAPTTAYAGLSAGDFVTTLGGVTTMAAASSNVGGYAITAAGTAVTSAAGHSYRIVYVPGTLTVAARPVTVTADAQSRAYGDANPALTYTTTSLGAGAALSGALATAATATSVVGAYAITQGTLAASSNYAMTYTGADLTVSQRPVTVTADAKSRAYGEANPALTYTVSRQGLVNGDTLYGGLTTSATPVSSTGLYPIGQGTLAAAANYAVAYVGADLTVTAAAISPATPSLPPVVTTPTPPPVVVVTPAPAVPADPTPVPVEPSVAMAPVTPAVPPLVPVMPEPLVPPSSSPQGEPAPYPTAIVLSNVASTRENTVHLNATTTSRDIPFVSATGQRPTPISNVLADPRAAGTVVCITATSCIVVPDAPRPVQP